MSTENSNTTENMVKTLSGFLFGRRDIYSSAETITADNVIWEVNSALVYHLQNVAEEEYLYWYRRGIQPILNRQKDRNEFINNKILQNTAEEIVTFKNGYFLMEPAFYVSRKAGAKNRVDKLNEYLYRSGKQSADNIVADWFHMVGKAALFVEPGPDDDTPIKAYAVDPRSCFVVYSMRPGNKPLFGVNVVTTEDTMLVDVYTQDSVFKLRGGYPGLKVDVRPNRDTIALELISVEPNRLAPHIPIIEYRYNSVNEGSFESVIYLLDALNTIRSNQVDGVEQFIQSIAVAVNCQFEEGTTADKIKAAGMIALTSIGENKADFRILSEELNQEQTEELVDSIYTQILRICALPSSSSHGRGTYDSTGTAAIFNNGWEQASSAARNCEDLFRQSNRYFDEILVDVLSRRGLVKGLKIVDFELNFVRNETANIQSKAQAAQTMMAMGMHPELALKKSGLSNDPVADFKMSEKYIKMIWGDPDKAEQTEEAGNGFGEVAEVDVDKEENITDGSGGTASATDENSGRTYVKGYWQDRRANT